MPEQDGRIEALSRKMGPTGAKVLLSNLGKNKQFFDAIETPVGQELLKDCLAEIDVRFTKIFTETADEKDFAEFRAYKRILARWQNTINKYKGDYSLFIKNSMK